MIPKYDSLRRLKELFRELFQLDTADLDFGLYRLFRIKRVEIEAFLEKWLPAEVEKAFAFMADAERQSMQKQVEALARQAREQADDAILPTGQPNPKYSGIKAVREYAEACKRLGAAAVPEEQQAEVFNQLYAFFSRYYDEGDFIPRRFFGARSSYVIPYNGEEVFFHWANKDQYYVKSGEAFRDYAFTLSTLQGEYQVRFKLIEATTPKDNTKGDTRFFFPRPEEAAFDESKLIFTFPFEYRLPTESESARYGARNKTQEAILDEATPKILKAVTDDILGAALATLSPTGREAEGDAPPSLLRRRLTHFTRKNTTDYFVHKNLGAFLRQELEFFIRDQIVHEADLEGDFDAKRRMLRVFRKLAETVITFLAQIEDAQKRLFEKKKFVLRTDYLIPIQNVPRDLWKQVLTNKAQLQEWKALYALEPKSDLFNLKGKINEYVLEQNPTLVVDTRHFSPGFTARLLATVEDIDEQTGGVLIHGENFQALNLMQERYREQVKCIYIDPPYNTGQGDFIYKDNYQHASWLSMMLDRLRLGLDFLLADGALFVSIDDIEVHNLRELIHLVYSEMNFIDSIIWKKRYGGGAKEKHLVSLHEYILFFARDKTRLDQINVPLNTEAIDRYYKLKDEKFTTRGPYRTHPLEATKSVGVRPNLVYPITAPDGTEIWPERQWWWDKERTIKALQNNELEFIKGKNGWTVHTKQYLKDENGMQRQAKAFSIIDDVYTQHGTAEIGDLLGDSKLYSFPKPSDLISRLISIGQLGSDDMILDYFAGSGPTGHAVINLNREDGGQRKFILVEMADYFDTVMVPRIKKAMFVPEWKAGKPKRLATKEEAERTPRLVKVLRLESYEDALHNTFSESTFGRIAEREKAVKQMVGDEEYRIRYLVKLPLDASDAMLNLARLEHPFDYTMEVLTDVGPKTQSVDLVETFNWLYGLRVRRVFNWVNPADKTPTHKGGRLYRVVTGTDREGKKRVLIVWRDMEGLDPVKDRAFLEAKAEQIGPFEEQWINGDTAAKGFASLDGLFKRLMAVGEV